MQIRPIKPAEKISTAKIQTIAFLTSRDFNQSEFDPTGYETGRAVFNENNKMTACLNLLPFKMRFDYKSVKMGGIAGVATLPEERKKGYIRDLMYYCLQEMKERGQIFSYLYPFSHPFYRKFGYELNLFRQKYTIPIKSLSKFPESGYGEQYFPEQDSSKIKNIYTKFIEDKNLAVIRDEKRWERWLNKDPYKDNQYTYIWYNDQGEAEAYLIYDLIKKNHQPDMQIQELIWLNMESLKGILSFLTRFSSQFENLIWEAPDLVDFYTFFPEPYDLTREVITSGMNRIVDLGAVFKLMKYPEKAGEITIKVTDDFLDWNNQTYLISWDDAGLNEVSIVSSDNVDMVGDIRPLTQLITGFISLDQLILQQKVKVKQNYALLNSLFYKKKLYLTDRF